MATFTVLNTNSTGAGSLRDAVDQANDLLLNPGADTIVFAAGVTGAIQLTGGPLTILDPLILNGPGASTVTVVADAGQDGFLVSPGAGAEVAISGLTITGVNALAAIVAFDGKLKLTNLTVTNNDAAYAAVATLTNETVELSGVTISNNRTAGGGLNVLTEGSLRVENSTISGNTASPGGIGGVGFASGGGAGTALFLNTTIANNTGGGAAGGLYVQGGTAVMRDSTIAGNTDSTVSGVLVDLGNFTLENSIVYNPGGVDDLYMNVSTVVANYNLIGAIGTCGCSTFIETNNLFGVNPQLGLLANNGGLVLTMLPGGNSPVLEAGSATLYALPALDARGQPRLVYRLDLGAVEFQYPQVPPAPAPPPTPPPPSKAPEVTAAFANLTRFQTYGFNPPLPATVTTPDGKSLPSAFLIEQGIIKALITKVDAGEISMASARDLIVDMADATTSVATTGYQFFTGRLPTKAGLDYLVSSPENPADLNDGFYAGMSLENRYINFAVNLGTVGEGRANFTANYGALSLADAAAKAYTEIFGSPPVGKIADILTSDRVAYFTSLGGDALGAKAAMVGWLLAESAKSDTGPYAVMNENFLYDLTDGVAAFGADLHVYLNAGPRHIGLIGEA